MTKQFHFPEYSDFPPYHFFIDVMKHALPSLELYVDLWKMQDVSGRVVLEKDKIRTKLLISPTKFRNLSLDLIGLSLLSIDESANLIVVDLVQWDEDEFDEE